MVERLHFETREEWLNGRAQGIGASEAAQIVNMSPWGNSADLWRLKTGKTKAKDLSENEAVQRGVRLEPVLREFFTGLHDAYELDYFPYDILFQSERKWLFATLDGELTDKESGTRGVLEIKTGTSAKWAEWKDNSLPKQYEIQAKHQLLATGWDFVFVFGALFRMNGDIEIVEREIWREDCEADLDWLLQKETVFWQSVENGTLMPMPITF